MDGKSCFWVMKLLIKIGTHGLSPKVMKCGCLEITQYHDKSEHLKFANALKKTFLVDDELQVVITKIINLCT
jgi:hypothetical protein